MKRPASLRPLIVLGICAGFALLMMGLWWRGFLPLQEGELFTQDWRARLGRMTALGDEFVLIGIDKPVYAADFSEEELQGEPVLGEMQRDFPWSRKVWARSVASRFD